MGSRIKRLATSVILSIFPVLVNIPQKGLPRPVVADTTSPMDPHHILKDWLSEAGMTASELARRCEYDRSNMDKILKGTNRPSLALAFRLEQATDGKVPASSWIKAA